VTCGCASCDFMPPNVHQFTRELEEAAEPQAGEPGGDHPLGRCPTTTPTPTNFDTGPSGPRVGLPPERSPPGFGPVRRPVLRRAAGFPPTTTRSRASGPSASTRSSISPRRTAGVIIRHLPRRHPRGAGRPGPLGHALAGGKSFPTYTQGPRPAPAARPSPRRTTGCSRDRTPGRHRLSRARPMWIVRIALDRALTFVVLALLSDREPGGDRRTPTDSSLDQHPGHRGRVAVQRAQHRGAGRADHHLLRARAHHHGGQHPAHRVHHRERAGDHPRL